jgi:hypothetical protein
MNISWRQTENMFDIFTMSPYIAGIGVAVCNTLIILSKIWFPSGYFPPNKKLLSKYLFLQDLFRTIFFFFGVIFINIGVFWLSGQWIYADWAYQLPNVILGLIGGIQYVVGSLFLKPKKIELIFGIGLFAYIFCTLNLLILGPTNLEYEMIFVFVIDNILMIVYALVKALMRKKSEKLSPQSSQVTDGKPIWDISRKYNRVFNNKVIYIMWILASINVMLSFNGASIFGW